MFSAAHSLGGTGRLRLAALLVLTVIFCQLKNAESENVNCKNKVRNTWLQYCISDGVRDKRDVAVGSLRFRRHIKVDDGIAVPGDPLRPRFSLPMSGDDLGMGMSVAEIEDLYEEIVERMPRAPKGNKAQAIKTLTEFAARCCNENPEDATCSDPANVISCP